MLCAIINDKLFFIQSVMTRPTGFLQHTVKTFCYHIPLLLVFVVSLFTVLYFPVSMVNFFIICHMLNVLSGCN